MENPKNVLSGNYIGNFGNSQFTNKAEEEKAHSFFYLLSIMIIDDPNGFSSGLS